MEVKSQLDLLNLSKTYNADIVNYIELLAVIPLIMNLRLISLASVKLGTLKMKKNNTILIIKTNF